MMPQYHQGKPHHLPFPPQPDGIVDNFYRVLSQLTINSKPLITELSILAQQNPSYAKTFVSALEVRIFDAPPHEKLPLIYALDSIIKNVGGEYIPLFSHNLAQVFLDAFNKVDPPTKGRFLRVLETWKEGAFFPFELLVSIDSHIQQHPHFPPHGQPQGSFTPNRSPGGHMRRHPPPHHPHPYQRPPHPQQMHYDSQHHSKPRYPPQVKRPHPQQPMANGHQYSSPNPSRPIAAPVSAPALPSLPKLDASLIQTLLGTTSKSPQHSSSTRSQSTHSPQHNQQISDSNNSLSAPSLLSTPAPASTVVTAVVTLNQKDILAPRKNAYKVLYDNMPVKCGQCGIRFPPSDDIVTKQREHMDWHFRQNRQSKTKKSSARNWFNSENDWIESKESELNSQQVPLFFNTEADAEEEEKKDNEVHHVLVPPNHQNPYCPICKDKFQSVWSDAQEDWVYNNAVQIDEVIYHVNCYKDSTKFEGKSGTSLKPTKTPSPSPSQSA